MNEEIARGIQEEKSGTKGNNMMLRRKLTYSALKNSLEVREKVKKLEPEIDLLIEKAYIESVEEWLDNIEEHINSATEKIQMYKKHRIKVYKYELAELKEMKKAAKLKGKDREKYILDRAHREMIMFGSCHIIWKTKKRILKEVYNIDWLTPAEENPEICFD